MLYFKILYECSVVVTTVILYDGQSITYLEVG